MKNIVISVEHLSKVYHLGKIGNGAFNADIFVGLLEMGTGSHHELTGCKNISYIIVGIP
jgi:hypothetical protein